MMTQPYVDSILATEFGEFNIRVYQATKGSETVVLWKGDVASFNSVIVRVHSECWTGDVVHSLQCDCGKQLEKSLKIISQQDGVFIYLRQEGRGIGLFEKIKTYQLQRQGFDTFQANVNLGHKPDERTYEMVKTVLDDLKISAIRLLTNNPDKVSQIALLGIKVVERLPLIVKSNVHNKSYFATKLAKFNHLFKNSKHDYFYQFHVTESSQVSEIGDFLNSKDLDPLLKICVGISADRNIFNDLEEIKKIRLITECCQKYKSFIPVLHFSFKGTSDVKKDIKMIAEKFSFVRRLQINDLPEMKIGVLEFASQFFDLDIPLSDKTFDIIYKRAFRSLVKKRNFYVAIDNSMGRGIQDSKESIISKINILLDYGVNNIGIYGGFGPNELDLFFELREFFRINFSIDAETKLKTNQDIDLEKTKNYLSQLMRNRNRNKNGLSGDYLNMRPLNV